MLSFKFSYTVKYVFILLFIVVDLAFNATIDHETEQVGVLSQMGAQGVLRILSLFVMFLFMWNTFVFQHGLLGVLLSRFKGLMITWTLSCIFLAIIRIMRGAQVFSDKSVIDIWDDDAYKAIYILHNLFSMIYYMYLMQSCFNLGNPSLYKASTWLAK